MVVTAVAVAVGAIEHRAVSVSTSAPLVFGVWTSEGQARLKRIHFLCVRYYVEQTGGRENVITKMYSAPVYMKTAGTWILISSNPS
jgi:hypothetical protein